MRAGRGGTRGGDGRRRQVERFTERLTVLPFDAQAASHFAVIRANLSARGEVIGGYGMMIAGHARSRGLTVVGHKVRAFRRVQGLQFADWLADRGRAPDSPIRSNGRQGRGGR